jgi:hypothetical protein
MDVGGSRSSQLGGASFSNQPRIPLALQSVFLQANADLPLTEVSEQKSVGSDSTMHLQNGSVNSSNNNAKGAAPRHKQRSAKHKHAPAQPRKGNLPRVITFTAADAAAAYVKNRLLQNALEGFSLKDNTPTTNVTSSSSITTPLEYLNTILFERGYSTKAYSTLDTGFVNSPTEIQQASYNLYLSGLVAKNDVATFQQVMLSGLVAPNPCNRFGESVLHLVCRRGRLEMLHIMLQAGASIHVIDDFGRTPLVDACWSPEPAFDVVKVLLDHDARLVNMCDLRGALPLSYVPKQDYVAWIQFLDSVKDIYWPHRGISAPPQGPPSICSEPPRSRPIPQPRVSGVSCEIATLVASGQMSPQKAHVKLAAASSSSSSYDEAEEMSMHTSIHTEDEEGATVSDGASFYSDEESDDDEDDVDSTTIGSTEVHKIFADLHHRMAGSNAYYKHLG